MTGREIWGSFIHAFRHTPSHGDARILLREARDVAVGPGVDVVLATVAPAPLRPPARLCVMIDVALAVGACALVGSLPFGDRLRLVPAGLEWRLSIVVASQIAALGLLQAYARRAPLDWLLRVIAGILAGTAVGSVLVTVAADMDGVAPGFVLVAMLLGAAAVSWRIAWVLAARAHRRGQTRESPSDLVDRSAELISLRGVVSSLYGYRELLKNLVFKDVKLKYRGSVFGFLWSLANPLLMIVVYATAFTFILRIRSEGFVFYLMIGQLAWTFFASSAAMSTGSVVDNAGLLKSVLFPRAILPIGTVLFNLVQFLLTFAVFLPTMMLWYRVPFAAPMLLFPIFLILHVTFTIGIALILATATAFFRDVRHLLEVALSVLFWTTPIVYELQHVPERLQPLVLLSPVASFVVAYQQIFFYRVWPESMVWLVTSGYALGTFVVGALLFMAFEDRFTEQL